MRPLGVILAGGRATRMGGGDKGRHLIDGQSLFDLVIARLRPQIGAMALNANGDAARFADLGLPVVPDSLPDYPGPLAGVLAGLDWAAGQGADAIVTVAADTPFFPADLVEKLSAHGPLALAATPDPKRGAARHPTFGLWPTALREDLRANLEKGLRKVVLWTDQHAAQTVLFPDEHAFFNVNTPEDLTRAAALAAEAKA